ncbi:transglycosylase domain-containing protein [Frondihabitans sp. 4ASC-45]|uniref:transglycosylase domain-containing protein n=1 Tax=Frondihabitans sp. 4ASC-45 TaxID=3111636 RepID=UPI003C140AD2
MTTTRLPRAHDRTLGGLRALGGFAGLSLVAGLLCAVLAVPALVVASNTVTTGVDAFDSLPSYLEITPPAQASSLYAKDGSTNVKIASFYTENRTDVTADQIATAVKNAAVDTEDPRFYDEGAIDVAGTIRGVLATTLGGSVQGGSSITQQYVKNVLVERCATENTDAAKATKCYEDVTAVTPERKLREMRYAISVEKKYSKSEILTGYLNIVGFGGNIYGIQAAAEYYFGVSASRLTIAQSATLVAIINNPSNLRIDQPTDKANGSANHFALTQVRRDYVLQRMYVHGSITKAQLTAATASVITPTITAATNGCASAVKYDAGYFCDYVLNVVKNDEAFGSTADARLATLNQGGLKIETTLDLAQQRTAQASLSAVMPATVAGLDVGASNVAVEPGSGRILTMVQNTDYTQSDQATAGQTGVNYNTDQAYGGSTGFQTGSAFKAFTLAAWLEAGHSLSDYVTTGEHDFSFSQFTNSCSNIGSGTWSVANAESVGSSMSVLTATQESINTAYAEMGTQLDLCNIIKAATDMGVHTATTGGTLSSVPSSILGTNTISPLTMATAYAGIANNGVVCTPVVIDSITGANGTKITATPTSCTQGMSSEVAAGVSYALQTVLKAGGTGALANPNDGVDMLAKTGTNDNAEQNWLVTSTTKVATATWVGNVSGSTSFYDTYIGSNYGYNVKFLIAKPILASLDAAYGGGTLTAPPASEVGSSAVSGSSSSSSSPSSEATGAGSGTADTGTTDTGGAAGTDTGGASGTGDAGTGTGTTDAPTAAPTPSP